MITPPRGVESTGEIVATAPRLGPLLLLVAVEFEARRLAHGLGLSREPTPARGPLVLRRVGLAAGDLPRLGPALAGLGPAGVVAVGLAGGCAPDVRPGEIVLGSATGSADGEWLVPDATLTERALVALGAAAVPHRIGRLLTVEEIVATPSAKARCWQRHGALAVDMESARVLRWARDVGIPALAVRAVADGPADFLPPELLGALDADGRLRPLAILRWAGRPALVATAWRLGRRSRVALDRLARFLAAFTTVRP